MLKPVFLHGGGDDAGAAETTFARIVAALGRFGRLAFVVAEADEEEAAATDRHYRALFGNLALPATRMTTLFVTPNRPLRRSDLDATQPAVLFVCGGVTPLYHASLCADLSWTKSLREQGVIYAGTSAGAAVAPSRAILGGWLAPHDPHARQVLFRGAGEGLERLTVAGGLGLVPFSVDVHASQWGTLGRLVHAVAAGLVDEGWAIDENTMLEVAGDRLIVHGQGHAYRARRDGPEVAVRVHVAPEVIPLAR